MTMSWRLAVRARLSLLRLEPELEVEDELDGDDVEIGSFELDGDSCFVCVGSTLFGPLFGMRRLPQQPHIMQASMPSIRNTKLATTKQSTRTLV